MGLVSTYMRRCPAGQKVEDFYRDVSARFDMRVYDEEIESYEMFTDVQVAARFDEFWEAQENLKRTDEIKEKYRKQALEGRGVVVVETDE